VPTVEIDGVELAYEESGDGPPLVLIHGTGGATWGPLTPLLEPGYRTIWYHRRSFGASAHEPLADLPRHTSDAAALLEALDAGPAVVVGHSMGGVISIDLAVRRPDLVRALVVVEPPLHFTANATEDMMRELGAAMELLTTEGDQAAAVAFMRWATTTTDGWNGYDMTPPEIQAQLVGNSAAIVRELAGGTGEHTTPEELGSISCPAICLVGAITLPEYAQAAERLARALPAVEVVTVPGAGHVLPASHPQAVADAVARVAGNPAPTA
jgi:pimeloyl-ACP methyl ester carboxylesterase